MKRNVRGGVRRRERGAIIVLAAFLLVIVGAFLALSLNTGHGVVVRGALQNASDAAALAGVRELNGSLAGIAQARAFANDFAGRHESDPRVTVAPEQIEFGNWNPDGRTWTPLDSVVANLYRINAVRVVTARAEGSPGGGSLPAYFGRAFLGRETFDVRTEAIAYAGAPCPTEEGCDSPFVIRYACLFTGDLRCGQQYVLGMSAATIDGGGLSDMNPGEDLHGSASAAAICNALKDRSSQTCTIGTSELKTTNGNELKKTCTGRTICQRIKTLWPAGSTMLVPIVMYENDSNPMGCDSGQYGGPALIVSMMRMRVDGVWCQEPGSTGRCAAFAAQNCAELTALCDETGGQPGACLHLGSINQNPRLAR